ncbi:MAG: sulfite exporter TauE/SafE family protein [Alphaproteobacteria bacterium]|nr:sulfite exporter TauE/SafE family protein [Alphaproteobacteria bacterium]
MDAQTTLMSPDVIMLIAGTFLFAGLVKGVLGLGLPVVVTALLAATLGLKSAIGLMLVPSVVMNVWQALVGGGFLELLRRLWPLFAMSIAGIWMGVQILARSDAAVLLSVLAVVLIIYSGWSLARAQVKPPGRWEPILTPVIGGLSGMVFGMVGNFMVPGVLYLQALGLGRDRLVQALGMTFVIISLTMMILMSRYSLVNEETLGISAAAMLPALIGMVIGRRMRGWFSEAQFRTLFFVGLMIAGVYMLYVAQAGGAGR